MSDTVESDAVELLTFLGERHGVFLIPSGAQPGILTRIRFAGDLLEQQGKAFWYCASLLEQMQGFEPYVLCFPETAGSRYHVSLPDGRAAEPYYPKRSP